MEAQLRGQLELMQTELAQREATLNRYRENASAALAEKDGLIAEMEERLTGQQREMETLRRRAQQVPAPVPAPAAVARPTAPTITGVISSTSIGSIEGYQRSADWSQWLHRLVHYMSGNNIEVSRRKDLFLSLLGQEGYALASSLCAPELPGDKTYEALVELMSNHLKPKPSIITERYKFNMYEQVEGQSVSDFWAGLKRLSIDCEFGSNLNDTIRDRFVCGLRNKATKRKLLSEKNLTYARAIEVAISDEAASRDIGEMDHQKPLAAVNYVRNHQGSTKSNVKKKTCNCCGRMGHWKDNCRFKEYSCDKCKKKGHLAAVCFSKENNSRRASENSRDTGTAGNSRERKNETHKGRDNNRKYGLSHNYMEEIMDLDGSFDRLLAIDEENPQGNSGSKPMKIKLLVERQIVEFEVDTGSPISAISTQEFRENPIFKSMKLCDSNRKFKSYTGSPIIPLGILEVEVNYNDKRRNLELFVLPGSSEPIMGRQWILALGISLGKVDVSEINNVSSVSNWDEVRLREKFPTVLTDKLGRYKLGTFNLALKDNVNPVFAKPRVLPYAMITKVDAEIDRLVKADIIFPVKSSDWATPVVPILKSDGEIRLCGDYKMSLNKYLKTDRHPIPRIADLLSKINEGKCFSRIDLSHAYQQVELDDESRLLTTISTHRGLFAYKRLCFGVSSAPGLFQRLMEKLFVGISGVIIFFDDILIYGSTWAEHDERLLVVMSKLEEAGLTARQEKCKFFKTEVKFLGFKIDERGIHVLEDKIKAIVAINSPQNVTELKRFLGMANYYAKFIRNYAQAVSPLYTLLRKDVEWSWRDEHQHAFCEIKKKLISSEVLVQYDPNRPIKITCDASPSGIGAVLSHVISDRESKPIAFFSRSLTQAEKNYSQLDREALALVFGVKSCHQFVWGRKFMLETDHKPLKYIFDPNRSLPSMVAGRVQRWAVFLSGYDFVLKHIEGKKNVTADCLSRAPIFIGEGNERKTDFSYINCIQNDIKMFDMDIIVRETKEDKMLCKVIEYVKSEWPKVVDDLLICYKRKGNELYVESDCLMWGTRIVIPEVLRGMILKELHSTHMGIVKMKSLARSYVWWPGIDNDIERITKQCRFCLESASNPPRSELHTWKWPEGPSIRIHIDFLQIGDKMFLIIHDAFSKWIDVKLMKNITSSETILSMMEYFATWGLPVILVSDNGPSLVSDEFELFLKGLGIFHVRTAPYHPASNGAAENAVKTFKKHFKLLVKEGFSLKTALTRFLFSYRSTVHCTTGCTPADLHLGRPMRSKWDLLRPNLRNKVLQQQMRQVHHAPGSTTRVFGVGEPVMAKDVMQKRWLQGEVIHQNSPVTYTVQTMDGRTWKRHVDQLRGCELPAASEQTATSVVSGAEKILVASSENRRETKNCSLPAKLSGDHENVELSHSEKSASRNNSAFSICDHHQGTSLSGPIESTVPAPPAVIPESTRQESESSVPELRRSTRKVKPIQRLNL